jgi:hypothetical protein
MSSSSLLNFTVPLGNTGQLPSSQGLLMPKLSNRFSATFLNFGQGASTTELTKQIVSITRPQVEFEPVVIDVYNSKVKYAGKPTWQNTTVVLRDDALGTVTALVGEQIQTQFDFNQQASAASASDYKFQINYEVLDGGNGTSQPNVLETWELYGCFITSVEYGEMQYSEANPMTITLQISFDNALQAPLGSGIGTAVPRTIGFSAI